MAFLQMGGQPVCMIACTVLMLGCAVMILPLLLSTSSLQVPGYTLMVGKGLFTAGRFNCTGTLRSALAGFTWACGAATVHRAADLCSPGMSSALPLLACIRLPPLLRLAHRPCSGRSHPLSARLQARDPGVCASDASRPGSEPLQRRPRVQGLRPEAA